MKTGNQVLSILLLLALMLTMTTFAPVPAYGANVGQNAYGHQVTYTPVQSLFATYKTNQSKDIQRRIKLFDATMSQWNKVPGNMRKYAATAKTWLNDNQYLLNDFGRYNGAITSQHWNDAHKDHRFSGTIGSISGKHEYNVFYEFDPLRTGSPLGNITNMLQKGDIEYFFTTGVKTVQTSWFLFWESNDFVDLWFLDEHWEKKGDAWHDINWNNGPAFSDAKAWKASSKIGRMHFKAESDRDKTIDAYMGWGLLVGRDIAGPRIQSVGITADPAGNKPISGAITLDTLRNLTNRTVYFQVTWDEPVQFAGLSNKQIAELQLEIQTLGVDGTSGMPAKASLLRYVPLNEDSKPVMTFEYQIPDPYTDTSQVAQERGYYYKFSKIAVGVNDNKSFWNSLQDISGNKFAANKNGQQPSGKAEYVISGAPLVDILPFAVQNIRTAKSAAPEKIFAQAGETFSVMLELNKTLASSGAAPGLVLNIQDKSGADARLTPSKITTASVKGALGGKGSVLTYQLVLDPSKHQNKDPDSLIKVKSLSPGSNARDSSGYTLLNYTLNAEGALSPTNLPEAVAQKLKQYVKSPDKQYKLDFTPPDVSVDVAEVENGVVMAKATVTDTNLEGCSASFNITADGKTERAIKFQASTSEGYDSKAWREVVPGNTQISFGAPLMGSGSTKYTYAFIKLPDAETEIGGVAVTVTAADEAGNQTIAKGKLPPQGGFWSGVDNLAPVVTLEKAFEDAGKYAGKDEYAKVTVKDMNSTTWEYVWQNTFDAGGSTRLAAPGFSGAMSGGGAAHFPDPDSLGGNMVHYWTLWVRAADSANNTSEPVSMDFAFDRTYAEIIIKEADTETKYTGSSYPRVELEINNVQKYWYAWVERPANYIGMEGGRDFGDLATYFKYQTGSMSSTGVCNFATEGTPDSGALDAAELFKTSGLSADDAAVSEDGNGVSDGGTSENENENGNENGNGVIDGEISGVENGIPPEEGEINAGSGGEGKKLSRFGTMALENKTNLTIEMNSLTQVARHGDIGEYPYDPYSTKWAYEGNADNVLAQAISAKETTRPVALLIWAQGGDGSFTYKAVEFETFYKEPDSIQALQERFSSNDNTGERVDNTREMGERVGFNHIPLGLYWPSDYEASSYYGSKDAGAFFNLRSIHGFAEADFYISGDPLSGLDRVDLENSVVTLEQVQYNYWDDYSSTQELDWANENNVTSREKILTWKLSDLDLRPAQDPREIEDKEGNCYTTAYYKKIGEHFSDFHTFTLNFDPALVQAVPFVVGGYDYDGQPQYRCQRYEFRIKLAYENGAQDDEDLLSYWIFDNGATARAMLYGLLDEEGHYVRHGEIGGPPEGGPVAAVFDSAGNEITPNIPVITFGPWPWMNIEKARIQFVASEYPYSFGPEYWATRQSKYEDPPVPLGLGLKVRYGRSPDSLNFSAVFEESQSPDDNYMNYGAYGTTIPVSPGNFPAHGSEITLYYQFYDDLQGGESPIYVVELRRDDEPPVLELSVSETTAPQHSVAVKLEAVYDIHEVGSGGETTYVIDTPLSSIDLLVEAWRKIYPGEKFNTTDPDGEDYYDPNEDFRDEDSDNFADHLRVRPDENGVYNFTGNGFMRIFALDAAGNFSESILVNGEPYTPPGEGHEGAVYIVGNIDREPPEFTEEPVWTPDAATGSFTLSATADESAAAAYLRFDKDYAGFLAGIDYDEHTVEMEGDDPETGVVEDGYTITIPAADPPMYALENLPGRFSGSFDPETGKISLTAYVKYDENGTAGLAAATLIVVDSAGNAVENEYAFTDGLGGVEPKITNVTNAHNYPLYSYGGVLKFTVPVKINDYKTDFKTSYDGLPLYEDGPALIGYTDLFGVSRTENVYADIFGPAFKHSLTFRVGETEISPMTPTNQNVTVRVDTSATTGLTVAGGGTATGWETTLSENGTIAYSLTNSTVGQEKTFTLPVTNIDKTPPTAIVNAAIDSAEKETTNPETGETTVEMLYYSITYEICGFNKSGVAVLGTDGSPAPAGISFDKSSVLKTHTFRFRDEAGNEGAYTADVSGVQFSDPADSLLVGYRLTYDASGTNGMNRIGSCTGEGMLNISPTNSDVVVRAEGLNAAGEVVPATFTVNGGLPAGAVAFAPSKSILFIGENEADRSVTVTLTGSGSGNALTFPLILPGGTIDKTPPAGTVCYAEVGGGVKAYLLLQSTDIPEEGVTVTGQRSDGTALVLEKDADGYYVEFDENGSGHFLLRDNAGNTGSVAISVLSIDNLPPGLGAEGWSAETEASSRTSTWADDLARILRTPTNNSIKVFLSFNEQLSKAEVTVYNKEGGTVLTPAESYVTAVVSGNTVTIEFLQNCQAKIAVYDLRGNETVLWRPEDGPITVIDKEAPELENGYPIKMVTDNKAKITYSFKNNEEVMLLSDPAGGYKNSHTVEFTENGQYVLTFADRAGNVLSVHPTIEGLDVLAPHVKFNMDFCGEGEEYGWKGDGGKDFAYTNRNVRILLNVTDDTAEDLQVTAKRLGGAAVEVTKETVSQTVGEETKTYNYTVTITENGVYEISAKDRWGYENTLNINVTLIDRTPPVIKMENTKAVSVQRNSAADALKLSVLQGVTAADAGAGKAEGGVTISADVSGVDLAKAGSYSARITAADPLGNTAVKTRMVNVRSGEVRLFEINGQTIEANDVYSTSPDKVTVSVSDKSFGGEKAALYYAQGYKTIAEMKYARLFDGAAGFMASEKGYYTIMAQSAERGMYLVYVYVY